MVNTPDVVGNTLGLVDSTLGLVYGTVELGPVYSENKFIESIDAISWQSVSKKLCGGVGHPPALLCLFFMV